jgi:hypothetical protein
MHETFTSHGIPGLPELVTKQQVMKLTRWSHMTVDRRIADGTLVAVRIGPRDVRITLASVQDLLKPIGTAPRWETPLSRQNPTEAA